jgi:uncharacterized protein YqgV (UPF0045/DUF77 family)
VAQVRIEFTVEPFVEGHPGPHVLAAIGAVEARGLSVDVGPFSSVAEVSPQAAGAAVAEMLDAALAHGATRVSLQVERVAEADG